MDGYGRQTGLYTMQIYVLVNISSIFALPAEWLMIGCLGTNAIWNTFVIEVYYSYICSSVQIIWMNMPSGENVREVTSSNNFFLMVFAVIFLGADNKTNMPINMIMYGYLEIHMCDIS